MSITNLPDLVIPINTAVSNALTFANLRHMLALTVFSPETLDAATFNVEVSAVPGEDAVAGDWRTLQSAGSDVVVTADDATQITFVSFRGLRIRNVTGNVAAARTFSVVGNDF